MVGRERKEGGIMYREGRREGSRTSYSYRSVEVKGIERSVYMLVRVVFQCYALSTSKPREGVCVR